MNKFFIREILLSCILLLLMFLLMNPFSWFMPSMSQIVFLALFISVYVLFLVFVWKERVRDEREETHRSRAGRIAFLSGVSVMLVGVIVQTIQGDLDVWLLGALGATVLGKIGGHLYSRCKN